MLHILLLILKMIGIILLCILGILILAVLSLLFVPIRYRIEAVRKEGEGELPVTVRVKVTWLLHFLNILIRYAGELSVRVRIMIVTIYRSSPKERSEKEQKKPKKAKERRAKKSTVKSGDADEKPGNAPEEGKTAEEGCGEAPEEKRTVAEERRETKESRLSGAETITDNAEKEKRKTSEKKKDVGKETASPKQSILDRIRAFFRKIRAFFEKVMELFVNIEYTIRQFCDKIKSVWNAIEFRYEVLTSDRFREAWALCQKELGRVLRNIKPAKLEADIIVGMDDPAATGEILAVCGMLYPLIGAHVNVTGDFEKKRLEGRFFMKGRISGFVLLWAGFKLYRNDNLKKVYGLLKKGGSING